MPEEIKSHHYWPSWLHMGDCDICGNVADHPIHDVLTKAEIVAELKRSGLWKALISVWSAEHGWIKR